jgi:hypothetical protein
MTDETIWKPLSPGHIQELFGKTVATEEPVAFRADDLCVVLRGETEEGSEEETLYWCLYRMQGAEPLELARDYGVEEVDGDVIEVSWDGLFPHDWLDAFVSGQTDWIRLSVTEICENFGDTVEFEQPSAYRHRDGVYTLVLTGDVDEETEEEEYAWSLVQLVDGEYTEVAYCDPGNLFGEEEFERLEITGGKDLAEIENRATPAAAGAVAADVVGKEAVADLTEEELNEAEELWDGWWEQAPYEWADRVVAGLKRKS